MNAIALFGLGLVILIFQTTLFGLLGLSYLKAPLILSLVVYAAFYMEPIRGLILSFLLGYAMDVYSGGARGITPLVMVLLCLLGQRMSMGIVLEGKVAVGLVAFIFGVLQGGLWMEIEALLKGIAFPKEIPISRIIVQSVVLAFMSPFLVGIAAVVDRLATTGWRRVKGRKA